MKKLLLTLALGSWIFASAQAQTTWEFDKGHTFVNFEVSHMVVSTASGAFKVFEGTVVTENEDFSGADIQFSIDAGSIDTDNERRDGHLKSPDFFEVEKYPEIKFKSTSFTKLEGKKYKLVGDLTMKDVTKPIELEVTFGGVLDMGERGQKAGFRVKGTLNRFDYGLEWNRALEAGGLVVGEDVDITVNVELNKKKE